VVLVIDNAPWHRGKPTDEALAGNASSLRVLEKLGLERVGEVMLPEATEPTVKLARAMIGRSS
jgi:hypothetical protein